jgi:hypothetical protein
MGDKITRANSREDEAYITYGRNEHKLLPEYLNESGHWGDLAVDERIILVRCS